MEYIRDHKALAPILYIYIYIKSVARVFPTRFLLLPPFSPIRSILPRSWCPFSSFGMSPKSSSFPENKREREKVAKWFQIDDIRYKSVKRS